MIQVQAPNEIMPGMSLAADRDQYFWQHNAPLVELWRSGRGVSIATERRRVPELIGAARSPRRASSCWIKGSRW